MVNIHLGKKICLCGTGWKFIGVVRNPQTISTEWSLPWEANDSSASYEIPCTESSLPIFTRACNLCVSWVGWIYSSLFHSLCTRYILICLKIHYIPNPELLQFISHIHKLFLKHLFLLLFHLPRNWKYPFKHYTRCLTRDISCSLVSAIWRSCCPYCGKSVCVPRVMLGFPVISLLCKAEHHSDLSLNLPSESAN